jgi:ABC-type glycerol-3-phosphate transport system permease component
MNTRHLKRHLVSILLYTVLIVISMFMLLPFVWMVSTSFKLPQDVFGFPPVIWSERSTAINYIYLIMEKTCCELPGIPSLFLSLPQFSACFSVLWVDTVLPSIDSLGKCGCSACCWLRWSFPPRS